MWWSTLVAPLRRSACIAVQLRTIQLSSLAPQLEPYEQSPWDFNPLDNKIWVCRIERQLKRVMKTTFDFWVIKAIQNQKKCGPPVSASLPCHKRSLYCITVAGVIFRGMCGVRCLLPLGSELFTRQLLQLRIYGSGHQLPPTSYAIMKMEMVTMGRICSLVYTEVDINCHPQCFTFSCCAFNVSHTCQRLNDCEWSWILVKV